MRGVITTRECQLLPLFKEYAGLVLWRINYVVNNYFYLFYGYRTYQRKVPAEIYRT